MRALVTCLALVLTLGWLAEDVSAQRRGGRGGGGGHFARSGARTSVHSRPSPRPQHHANVNRRDVTRDVNRRDVDVDRRVNRDVDVRRSIDTRDVDIDIDNDWDGCCFDHPVAAAAAVTAAAVTTAAVVGSVVYTLPPACTAVIVDGITYEQCGSTWYQPQFAGTTATYIVVAPPR
jgi:hypothetical protein